MQEASAPSPDFDSVLRAVSVDIAQISKADQLKTVWQKYLGRKGSIKLMLSQIGQIDSAEERKLFAGKVQQLQAQAARLFEEREKQLTLSTQDQALRDQAETLNLKSVKLGHLHPITQTIREMNRLFISMGFSIVDGPEIERDEFCFQRLNVPPFHPARDMQDTI